MRKSPLFYPMSPDFREASLAGAIIRATRAEHYMYSSAADYAGEKGMLEIILIE